MTKSKKSAPVSTGKQICDAIHTQVDHLGVRWADEAKYEDIKEYEAALNKELAKFRTKVLKITKRPFGCTFQASDGVFGLKCVGSKVISYTLAPPTNARADKKAILKSLETPAIKAIAKDLGMKALPVKPRVITSVALPTPEAVTAAYAPVAARPEHKDVVAVTQQIDTDGDGLPTPDCACGHDASYHKGTTGKCAACDTCKKFATPTQAKETTIPQPPDEPRGKAKKMMALSAVVSAAKHHDPPKEPPVTALTKVLGRAGFQFVRAEVGPDGAVAYGYAHSDGRAALCTAHQDDVVSPETVVAKLETGQTIQVTAAQPEAAKSLWEVLKPVSKKQRRIRQARYDGQVTAAKLKTDPRAPVKETPEQALMAIRAVQEQAAKDAATIAAVPVNGVPAHVVRAVEMLGMITGQKFNVIDLRGDKNYSHRMALLKKLFNRDRVLVEEIGINNLTQAFYSAVGVGEGSRAAQAVEFMTRCKEITTTSRAIKRAVVTATKKVVKAVRRVHMPALVVPGRVLEVSKPLGRKRQLAKDADVRARLQEEVSNGAPLAQPHPALRGLVVTSAKDLRILNHKNGVVSLKLERCNSQGAIQVWDNGAKLVTSVLTPTLVKDVKPQPWDANMIAAMVDALLASKSERTQDVEDNLRAAKSALQRYAEPARLAPLAAAIPTPRPTAAEVKVSPSCVQLLGDPLAGLVFVQLEKSNSQGAICVYNDSSRVVVGVVPTEWLNKFRPATNNGHALTEEQIARAINQLLNPATPTVAVTPTAARHLTAVLNSIEENKTMATNAAAISAGRKFTAPVDATKQTAKTAKTSKKAATATKTTTRRGKFDDAAKIVIVIKDNPYREGSRAHASYEAIKKSKTVGAFKTLCAAEDTKTTLAPKFTYLAWSMVKHGETPALIKVTK